MDWRQRLVLWVAIATIVDITQAGLTRVTNAEIRSVRRLSQRLLDLKHRIRDVMQAREEAEAREMAPETEIPDMESDLRELGLAAFKEESGQVQTKVEMTDTEQDAREVEPETFDTVNGELEDGIERPDTENAMRGLQEGSKAMNLEDKEAELENELAMANPESPSHAEMAGPDPEVRMLKQEQGQITAEEQAGQATELDMAKKTVENQDTVDAEGQLLGLVHELQFVDIDTTGNAGNTIVENVPEMLETELRKKAEEEPVMVDVNLAEITAEETDMPDLQMSKKMEENPETSDVHVVEITAGEPEIVDLEMEKKMEEEPDTADAALTQTEDNTETELRDLLPDPELTVTVDVQPEVTQEGREEVDTGMTEEKRRLVENKMKQAQGVLEYLEGTGDLDAGEIKEEARSEVNAIQQKISKIQEAVGSMRSRRR